MPDVEGLETLQNLRRISPDVRVLAISGGGRVSATCYLDMALKFGAQEALAKPFAAETFIAALNRVLSPSTPATAADPAHSATQRDTPPGARM
jgi:DNA-binding NtrC family response regulator